MFDLVREIERTDEVEIEQILKAVLRRYAELFLDWEVSTISVQKSSDPNEQIDRVIEVLQKMKYSF